LIPPGIDPWNWHDTSAMRGVVPDVGHRMLGSALFSKINGQCCMNHHRSVFANNIMIFSIYLEGCRTAGPSYAL
jgi:hypothetical protein